MKKICILFLLLLSCSKAEKPKSSFRVDLIDKETRVQDNLFNHVNGIWFKNTEIEKVKNNCHIWIQYLLKYLMNMPYYKKYISTQILSDI